MLTKITANIEETVRTVVADEHNNWIKKRSKRMTPKQVCLDEAIKDFGLDSHFLDNVLLRLSEVYYLDLANANIINADQKSIIVSENETFGDVVNKIAACC